jgi:hypothetical protein
MFSASKSGQYPGYLISRSVRLRSSASAYFNRTPASATNRQTWTWSAWIKRGQLGTSQLLFNAGTGGSDRTILYFGTGNLLEFYTVATTQVGLYQTSAVFRDPSAWYHIVCSVDTTNATAANRLILYVNGVQQTLTTTTTIAQNSNLYVNSNVAHAIGRESYTAANYFDGYLTEINFIDGQALTPASFGAYNAYGVWSPMKYNGTYGTNGFYLNFSDPSAATAAAIGKDNSGNGNNWTPNNISVTAGATYDSMLDVPTQWADGGNGRGNYCVMNPLTAQGNTVDNGNLRVTLAASVASILGVRGTMAIRSGDKFYWEVTPTTSTSVFTAIGIVDAAYRFGGSGISAVGSNCVLYYKSGGNKIVNGTTTVYGTTYAANDVIGIALDYSANTCTFYLNNVSQGAISLPSTSIEYVPVVDNENGVADVFQCNFGQRPFAYTPPTGFVALNTQNLPTPTILKGNQYFDATLYTGNGSTQSIVNSGAMQPDFVWSKSRNGAFNNVLRDSVRGATQFLYSNTTGAEATAGSGYSFDANGFSVGSSSEVNGNTTTYVGWQWKEGATQGFDIVTYTGDGTSNRQISHSLGVTPAMIIVKVRSTTNNWRVWHQRLTGSTYYLGLNQTAAEATSSTVFNGQSSTTFTVGNDPSVNVNAGTFVAYLFSEVAGFSRFGSYTGNGSADGPFVFCGFRPRFVLFKRTDSSTNGNWMLLDSVRDTYNVEEKVLFANLSNAEATGGQADFLSNGFKIRTGAGSNVNESGGTYIFAAFAENPLKYSLAR